MKPLIFQFKETPKGESLDFSGIEYDTTLNLSVSKITRQPAIDNAEVGTETFTRQNETSDSDFNSINILMDTETATKSDEGIDSDANRFGMLMDTATDTFVSSEDSDSDKNNYGKHLSS
jgi:hypothetical protein